MWFTNVLTAPYFLKTKCLIKISHRKKKKITIFREEATWSVFFSCGSSILVELEFGDVSFLEGGKPGNQEKNTRSKQKTNNKLNHIWHQAGT